MKLHKIAWQGRPRLVLEREAAAWLLAQDVTLSVILGHADPLGHLGKVRGEAIGLSDLEVLAPIDDQDIWACGVTYFSSRRARMADSGSSASIYDRIYGAERPLLFPKGRGRDVVGPGARLFLRDDSTWTVPEPELVLVFNAHGSIVGATAGNDFSCRDIEGDNPLYQPQAKIWAGGCALGPCIEFTSDAASLTSRLVELRVERNGSCVFSGDANTSAIVRPLAALGEAMFRFRNFPDGAFLFTGTGVIPPDDFASRRGDVNRISIEGIGDLVNAC